LKKNPEENKEKVEEISEKSDEKSKTEGGIISPTTERKSIDLPDDVIAAPGGRKSWSTKMGSIFKIFQANPSVEPQYLVRSENTYDTPAGELLVKEVPNKQESVFNLEEDGGSDNENLGSAISSDSDNEENDISVYASASDEEDEELKEKAAKAEQKIEEKTLEESGKVRTGKSEDKSLYERTLLGIEDSVVSKKVVVEETVIPKKKTEDEQSTTTHDRAHALTSTLDDDVIEHFEEGLEPNLLSKMREEVHLSRQTSPSTSPPRSRNNYSKPSGRRFESPRIA